MLAEMVDLVGNGWVYQKRANFLGYGHPLILLDIAGRYGMHQYLKADVFNTWLEAGTTDFRYLNEFIRTTVS